MITHMVRSPNPQPPPPTRVLLLGRGWELMNGTLAALTDTGYIELLGPEPNVDAVGDYDGDFPSVVLLAPDVDEANLGHDDEAPPVLRCVSDKDLDAPDLYQDSDDFVTVPCAATELIKRILRLAQKYNGANAADLIRVGTITVNPSTYQVTSNGRAVDLAWLEFQLLQFLMVNVGRVFTRDQLLANVWGVENIGGTRTVDVHIRRLRYKLETSGTAYFRTVKNVGYGMMEP